MLQLSMLRVLPETKNTSENYHRKMILKFYFFKKRGSENSKLNPVLKISQILCSTVLQMTCSSTQKNFCYFFLLGWGLFLTRSSVKCGADDIDSILEIKRFCSDFYLRIFSMVSYNNTTESLLVYGHQSLNIICSSVLPGRLVSINKILFSTTDIFSLPAHLF